MQLPPCELRLRRDSAGRVQVWCPLRRKWVAHTPEEHVRQCLVEFLSRDKGFPKSLLAIERALTYNGLPKRFDLLSFGPSGHPLLLCECKAPQVPLDEAAIRQACVYNTVFAAPWLLLANGPSLRVFHLGAAEFEETDALPDFREMILKT